MEVWPELGAPFTPYTLYVYVPGAAGAVKLAVRGDEPGPALTLGSGVAASLLVIQVPAWPLELRPTVTFTVYAAPGLSVVALGTAETEPTGVPLWHAEHTDL